MDIYAYMAIVDVLLRLAIANITFLLERGQSHLLCCIALFSERRNNDVYRFYCAIKFKEAVFRLGINNELFRQIASLLFRKEVFDVNPKWTKKYIQVIKLKH